MTINYRDSHFIQSWVSAWDPRWKLAGLSLFSAGVASLQSLIPAFLALALSLVILKLAKPRVRTVCERFGLVLMAIAPIWILFLFFGDQSLGTYDLGLTSISIQGVRDALLISLRAVSIAANVLTMLVSTGINGLLAAAHSLRVPSVLIQIGHLAYRYAQLFFAEIRRLWIALRARAFRPKNNRLTYQTFGHSIGSLVVRGSDRAERVADAMMCRGFHGHYLTIYQRQTQPLDVLCFVLVLIATISIVICDRFRLLAEIVS